ncbi:hypothetical protein N1851_018391 [Merluccius polli]|uniref:Uncharacterized protein n=1 Tax=Merluccius polli TaxID=89951 RepID=A0AA47MNR6_MERPO|nr:hypothetical protein N1851_018391 [Merluccius polli]
MDEETNADNGQESKSVNSSLKSYTIRLSASHSTSSSKKSSASLAAVKARAKAEAVRARTTFIKRKTELMVEKAQLEAALTTLKQEQECAAALVEAEILESAAAELGSQTNAKAMDIAIAAIPHDSGEKRTNDYVECHSRLHSIKLSPPLLGYHTQPNQPHDILRAPLHQDSEQNTIHTTKVGPNTASAHVDHYDSYSRTHSMNHPAARHYPGIHPGNFSPMKGPSPHTPPLSMQVPQSSAPGHTGINYFAIYMARRELVTSGMTMFDDRPDNYWGWRSTFMNVIQGLKLTSTEELDLLTRWLGPESSEQVRRVRAVNVSNPAAGLRMAWIRLDESYGSPEMVEKALLDKLERFPKITNKDPLKLRELGDLLRELESAKLEGPGSLTWILLEVSAL